VEAFKEKIKDPGYRNYSLLGIAFECGFNSKSALTGYLSRLPLNTFTI